MPEVDADLDEGARAQRVVDSEPAEDGGSRPGRGGNPHGGVARQLERRGSDIERREGAAQGHPRARARLARDERCGRQFLGADT